MKIKLYQMEKPLFFLLLCVVMCSTGTGYAVQSQYGKVTTNVNLRKYNGLHGKIITKIEKGERVLIKDKIGNWYKVIFERDTYGYIGWVYGKYVKTTFVKKKKPAPPTKKPRIIKSSIKEAYSEDPLGIIGEKQPSRLNKTPKDTSPLDGTPAIKKVEKTQPVERKISKITLESTSPENFLSPREIKEHNTFDETQKYAQPLWRIPFIEKNENNQSPMPKGTDNRIGHFGTADFMKLGLRLLTIVLSCLSILLSYKALQLTIKLPTLKSIASSLLAVLQSITRIRMPLMNNTPSSRVS
jgi:uncharacterized protein YgiM (DUF1202 family)